TNSNFKTAGLTSFHYFYFFFSCDDYHRILPSFPTRRSSDLDRASRPLRVVDPAAVLDERSVVLAEGGQRVAEIDRDLGCRRTSRSEEHTSELQSLAYIVCRLLLEKKKRNNHRRKCMKTF